MALEHLRSLALFEGLDDEQLTELEANSDEVEFGPGDELFRAGRPADVWWVLLAGSVDLVRHAGHEDNVLGTMSTPGQWSGGFQAWDPHGVYLATGRAATHGRALATPAGQLAVLAQAWFPFGVHLIKGLVQTVRTIESMARQREALVALGTLAAGLAHELNNPASAAVRAVDSLQETSESLLSSLGRLAEAGITPAQFMELDILRRGIEPSGEPIPAMDLADREEVLSDWLAEHGVEKDWLVAPAFAAAGVDVPWCERVATLLGAAGLGPALHWVASSLSTAMLLSEVKESTSRVSSLVAAVRSYSQLDRASVQRTDVIEGLESTLVVLSHKLETGVTVVRDYHAVPTIEAIAGELNQVWTNLIDNAIDAMGGSGTLRVSASATDGGVVVEIADTGGGIPAEIQPRLFEPFFTTKDVGAGTGLGLDISRRIVVERHGGQITVESRPEETVFRVRLPLRSPAPEVRDLDQA